MHGAWPVVVVVRLPPPLLTHLPPVPSRPSCTLPYSLLRKREVSSLAGPLPVLLAGCGPASSFPPFCLSPYLGILPVSLYIGGFPSRPGPPPLALAPFSPRKPLGLTVSKLVIEDPTLCHLS